MASYIISTIITIITQVYYITICIDTYALYKYTILLTQKIVPVLPDGKSNWQFNT
jgi:hypothetical protein